MCQNIFYCIYLSLKDYDSLEFCKIKIHKWINKLIYDSRAYCDVIDHSYRGRLPDKAPADRHRCSTRAGRRISPAGRRTRGRRVDPPTGMRRKTADFGWGKLQPKGPPRERDPKVASGPEINVVCWAPLFWPETWGKCHQYSKSKMYFNNLNIFWNARAIWRCTIK